MLLLRARASNSSLSVNQEQKKLENSSPAMIDNGKQDGTYISPTRGGAPGEPQSTSSGILRSDDSCSHVMGLSTTQAVEYSPRDANYTNYYQTDSYNTQQSNAIFKETVNEEVELQQSQLRLTTNYSPIPPGYYTNSYHTHPNNSIVTGSMNQPHSQQVMPITTTARASITARSEDGIESPLIHTSCASQSTTTYEISYESL